MRRMAPALIGSDMLDRSISFLVALSMAFLVWLYLRSRDQEMIDNVPVPVQIVLAPGQSEHFDLEITGPSQVPVSFSGPPSRIREVRNLLRTGDLWVEAVLTVPEDRLKEGRYTDTVRIEAGDIHPPPGVTALVVQGRNRIPVICHRLVERRLPVRFELVGEAPLAKVTLEPENVLVNGPQDILDRAHTIPTQPYALPHPSKTLTNQGGGIAVEVPLVQEMGGRPVHATPNAVRARITFVPQQKLHELADVPIQFLCPSHFALRPLFCDEGAGKMTVRLLGPAVEDKPVVVAYVDLTGRKWQPGQYEVPVQLQLPKDFQPAQTPLPLVAFQLVTVDADGKTDAVTHGR